MNKQELTKALQALFDRWNVKVREPRRITHKAYGAETVISLSILII
jgi:hypothetical protein